MSERLGSGSNEGRSLSRRRVLGFLGAILPASLIGGSAPQTHGLGDEDDLPALPGSAPGEQSAPLPPGADKEIYLPTRPADLPILDIPENK